MGADADVDVDAEEDEADAADAPAAAGLDFSPAHQHRTIMQRDSPHKQEAGRRACRPLQDMEETGAEETPPTLTKNGTIGMLDTAADLTCRGGTPAQRVRRSAARKIIKRATRATSTTNMWLQDGTPARLKCTKNICPSYSPEPTKNSTKD